MAKPTATPRNNQENSAQKYFKEAAQGDATAKQAYKKERATAAAKTANLRELRLAKEAEDKRVAETAPPKKRAASRARKAKSTSIRMIY